MKFNFNKLLSISALFALANLTIAAPLQDVSVTSVDLVENTYNVQGDEHLFVTVTRVDDLLDDDGSLLAERVMAVRVTFDVVENQLMCNGRAVEIGVSNIEVEAQIASNPAKLSITSEEDLALLADSFDVGLVTVEITANILDELKTEDGMTFRRISVKEYITEINGQRVVQTEAGQQILDVFDNGSLVKWAVDPLTGFMLPSDVETEDVLQSDDSLFEEDEMIAQIIIGFAFMAVLFGAGWMVRSLIVQRSNYAAVAVEEENAAEEKIWDENQKFPQNAPPAYVEEENQQAEHEDKKPLLNN